MRIIDADGHVTEGASLAAEAMQRWPRLIGPSADGHTLLIEGRPYPTTGPGAGCPTEHARTTEPGLKCRSAPGVLENADRDHIDTLVLFPSLGLCTPTLRDPEFAAGFARLYNRWIANYCASGEGRLHGIAVTPIEHGRTAIDIMREAKELGLIAMYVPPALRARNLDHPDLDPFYAAAVELDMSLTVHGAPGIHLPKIGVDRFTDFVRVHCIGSPFDQMVAMTAMVAGGVFDRHPALRVGFLEASAGWMPYFIHRLHKHVAKRGDWIENGSRRDPREYLAAGNIWATCEPDEPILPAIADALGDDFIMFGTEYPYWNSDWPESTKSLRLRSDISDSTREKVAGLNAQRFYGLD